MDRDEILAYVSSKKLIKSGLIFRRDGSGVDKNNIDLHLDELSKIIQSSTGSEGICAACRTYGLEFFHLLECPAKSEGLGFQGWPLTQPFGNCVLPCQHCPMCDLFRSMLPRDYDSPYQVSWAGFGLYGSEICTPLTQIPGKQIPRQIPRQILRAPGLFALDGALNERGRGVILPTLSSAESAFTLPRASKTEPDSIDWGVIRSLIRNCQKDHEQEYQDHQATLNNQMASLRVIDCHQKRVVQAPAKCVYVALSYVWGDVSAGAEACNFNLDKLPPLIRDTIACTLDLGIQYLWCDRYCIPQDNPSQKHDQIRNMDQIYSGAWITIIAACSQDASQGLIGVSRKRKSMSSAKVGGTEFTHVRPNVKSYVETSAWNKRGWTYQEGLLSRRKLVFTDSSVYFQCMGDISGVRAFESPHMLLDIGDFEMLGLGVKLVLPAERIGQEPRSVNPVFPADKIGQEPGSVWDRLKEYTHRSLTFDSDILDAISGILNEFSKKFPAHSHLWGVPVYLDEHSNYDYPPNSSEMCASGLFWEDVTTYGGPLKRTCSRRVGFPTWSWAGSTRPIDRQHADIRNPTLSISVETEDGPILQAEEFFRIPLQERPVVGKGLYISAPVIVGYLRTDSYSPDGRFTGAMFEGQGGRIFGTVIDMESFNGQPSAHCLGIILGLSYYHVCSRPLYKVLLVQDHGSHFERIDTLEFERLYYWGNQNETLPEFLPILTGDINKDPWVYGPRPQPFELWSLERLPRENWEKDFTISKFLRVEHRTIYLR